MSAQTTLDDDAPIILDATCSFAHKWPAWATLRMDIRREVKPDIVGDATHPPFRDGCFDEVYLDPPHLFGMGKFNHDKMDRYGVFKTRKDWRNFASIATPEASRILKQDGLLHYKITETEDARLKVAHFPTEGWEIIAHKITRSKSNLTDKLNVHWLTMKPKLTTTKDAATPADRGES